ncbi:hypothetical protein MRB53_028790 [Persea americana]|uniref:Uncharacterized protein n=1 Tax=Persea americana TaxID=3435 RepID=A0ACC2KGK6_PERAE|nr:hypothetical protein MRB53_028790 [Persea americana]
MINKGMKAPQLDYNKFVADFSRAGKPDILFELAQRMKFSGKFELSIDSGTSSSAEDFLPIDQQRHFDFCYEGKRLGSKRFLSSGLFLTFIPPQTAFH